MLQQAACPTAQAAAPVDCAVVNYTNFSVTYTHTGMGSPLSTAVKCPSGANGASTTVVPCVPFNQSAQLQLGVGDETARLTLGPVTGSGTYFTSSSTYNLVTGTPVVVTAVMAVNDQGSAVIACVITDLNTFVLYSCIAASDLDTSLYVDIVNADGSALSAPVALLAPGQMAILGTTRGKNMRIQRACVAPGGAMTLPDAGALNAIVVLPTVTTLSQLPLTVSAASNDLTALLSCVSTACAASPSTSPVLQVAITNGQPVVFTNTTAAPMWVTTTKVQQAQVPPGGALGVLLWANSTVVLQVASSSQVPPSGDDAASGAGTAAASLPLAGLWGATIALPGSVLLAQNASALQGIAQQIVQFPNANSNIESQQVDVNVLAPPLPQTLAQYIASVCFQPGFGAPCMALPGDGGTPQATCYGRQSVLFGGPCLLCSAANLPSDAREVCNSGATELCLAGSPAADLPVCACANYANSSVKLDVTGDGNLRTYQEYANWFQQTTGAPLPPVLQNNVRCWWPACAGQALVTDASASLCPTDVQQCFAAINVTTAGTSSASGAVKETIINSCGGPVAVGGEEEHVSFGPVPAPAPASAPSTHFRRVVLPLILALVAAVVIVAVVVGAVYGSRSTKAKKK